MTIRPVSGRWTISSSGREGVCGQLRRLPPGQWQGAGSIKALDGSAIVKDANHALQIQTVLHGTANGAMPSWKQLSDTDLAAVISYTKNAWSNKTGQLVQPAEVVAQRGK